MSGGSYDYICFKIDDFANELRINNSPYRLAFRELLIKVSKAAHDVEWEDSGDYGEGRAIEAIKACFEDPQAMAKAAAYDVIDDFKKSLE